MAFSLADFKKTSRKIDGRQVLYPHQLRDDRFLAAISYAIDYYERMVGRPRREFNADTLLEFFGDPKLARGVVACLGRTYAWYEQHFDDVVDSCLCTALYSREITSSAHLRAFLYRYVNHNHHGFLPSVGHGPAIEAMCQELPINPEQLKLLLGLDSPANAVLVKTSGTPDAREIVRLYNYHSLLTALSYAESLQLTVNDPIFPAIRTVHNVARRFALSYLVDHGPSGMFSQHVTVTWSGERDALGSFRGSGRRIVRALSRFLATHPDAALAGVAVVHLRGKASHVILDKRAMRTLGAQVVMVDGADSWEDDGSEQLRAAWSRAFVRGETGGWRLRRDPEPIVTEEGVIVPDFGLQRGSQRASLVLAMTPTAVETLLKPLKALAGRVPVIVSTPPHLTRRLVGLGIIVVPAGERLSPHVLVTALPSPSKLAERHTTTWQQLDQILAVEGFVDNSRLGEILGVDEAQVEETVRGWRANEVTYIPGVGLCTAETVCEIRALLQPQRRRAA